jgi:hypothetical protein
MLISNLKEYLRKMKKRGNPEKVIFQNNPIPGKAAC